MDIELILQYAILGNVTLNIILCSALRYRFFAGFAFGSSLLYAIFYHEYSFGVMPKLYMANKVLIIISLVWSIVMCWYFILYDEYRSPKRDAVRNDELLG